MVHFLHVIAVRTFPLNVMRDRALLQPLCARIVVFTSVTSSVKASIEMLMYIRITMEMLNDPSRV